MPCFIFAILADICYKSKNLSFALLLERVCVTATMVAVDVIIEISYKLKDWAKSVIRTNAKREVLGELLSKWLIDQLANGEDKDSSPVTERDWYKVKIGLRVSDNTYFVESDTGNKAVTCGIVGMILPRLEKLHILPLVD